MRVCHLYDGHERVGQGGGSVPSVVWNLARETAALGHEVTVLERQWSGLPKQETRNGVRFERLNLSTGSDEPWSDVPYEMVKHPVGVARLLTDRTNFAVKASGKVRNDRFDIVHAHLPFAANVLAALFPSVAAKLVYTAHLGETTERVVNTRLSPDVFLAKRATRTIALNTDMAAAFRSRGIPADRVVVVPNGVDPEMCVGVTDEDCIELRDKYGLGDGPVVLFVGTLTPRKGVKDLVRAMVSVVEAHPDAKLVLTGSLELEPTYIDQIRSIIEDQGLGNSVVFTGYVPEGEVPRLYQLSTVFVLPSYEEGSSIAVAEAIASGTPVVASRIAGIERQIHHGVHGYLVGPGDVEDIATNVKNILSNKTKRIEMERAVRDRAVDLSWSKIARRIVDVYEEVMP